ncbi:MAG TPA: imidazole glycerol phosphate synthase subunit HisH [Acidimicrobiia bacterium]|jgi:glutamine amidotransferase
MIGGTIDVVDYRAGNAPSVLYALEHLGLPGRLARTPEDVLASDRLVLPGVGAARATLDSLREQGLVEALTQRVVDDGVPFLGICIGLQVLFDHSEEGDTPCLGWVPGRVRHFPADRRVPQIGWNEVRFERDHPVTRSVAPGHFYFVNSYFCVPEESDDVLGTTDYGDPFCSVVARGNIVATQFHTEKSGRLGLALLRGFSQWDAPC